MSCGVGRRRGLDPTLLWLWCRPAAVALIRFWAWESPYAEAASLEKRQQQQQQQQQQQNPQSIYPTGNGNQVKMHILGFLQYSSAPTS